MTPDQVEQLLNRPNLSQTKRGFFYELEENFTLLGSALVWILTDSLKTPMELYVLSSFLFVPRPAKPPDFPQGSYEIEKGELTYEIDASYVIRITANQPGTAEEQLRQKLLNFNKESN